MHSIAHYGRINDKAEELTLNMQYSNSTNIDFPKGGGSSDTLSISGALLASTFWSSSSTISSSAELPLLFPS